MANSSPAVAENDDREAKRLEELYSLGLLDTLSDLRFDQYTQLAAEIFGVPIAMISLIDAERQWIKSAHGVPVFESPRAVSFCTHAVEADEDLVVENALEDARFARNPTVAGDHHIRFYAGGVIRGPNGYALGTCCVIDREPREFAERDRRVLHQITRMVDYEIESRALMRSLRESVGQVDQPEWHKHLDVLINGRV